MHYIGIGICLQVSMFSGTRVPTSLERPWRSYTGDIYVMVRPLTRASTMTCGVKGNVAIIPLIYSC